MPFFRLKSKERLNFSLAAYGSPATVTTNIGDLGLSGTSSILDDGIKIDLSDLSSLSGKEEAGGGNVVADFAEELGMTPLQDSYEDTPMVCTPRTNSRIVKIVSKHSNV